MTDPERREAVEALVESHYAAVYRYAYRLAGSAADAEDLTQQAYLAAYRKLDQLRNPDRALSWLFSIARHRYLNSRQRKGDGHCVSLEDADEPICDEGDAPELTGEELSELLDRLPEEFRIPLLLFYFEDLSYQEIGEALELPVGTVMSRLSRARSHLRSCLRRPLVVAASKSFHP